MTFQGVLTAIVTPFHDRGVDLDALKRLVERQIESGISGLVPCGTTGEAPTLSAEEHLQVIDAVVAQVAGRVPVLAGIGSNDTATAIQNAKNAELSGAQGVLATVPYYNKPTQEGLFQHFRAIAEATPLEVCLYNVPSRTAVHMQPETVARLAEIDTITTLKEATGDMNVASDILKLCGDRITLLSGDDFTTLPFIALGGQGCISVASNVVPDKMVSMVQAARSLDWTEARTHHFALLPLFKALFCETNPIPVKTALAHLGWIEELFRLPLCGMQAHTRSTLTQAVDESGAARRA
jgi:4-hydroxy-tetrahydrodipicolinate synthase